MVTGSKRKVLAEALYLIRMSLMSEEEFTNGPQKSGLLSDEEALNFCVSKYTSNEDVKETKFSREVSLNNS